MKRIAFISEHASPLAMLGGADGGGQNVYVAQLAKHLGLMGYKVDVFTRWDNPSLKEVVPFTENVRVVHVKAGPKTEVAKEKLLPFMDEFAVNALHFMKQETYDLIHAHFFMSGYVAMLLKEALQIPTVITFHALGKVRLKHQGKQDGFPKQRLTIEEAVVSESDGIIAECPQDLKDLTLLYGASAEKIHLVPCGYSEDEFYPVPRRLACQVLGLNPTKRYLLQLGRMVPRKGVATVVKGFARYVKSTETKLNLIIVGGETDSPDPDKNPEIQRLSHIAQKEGVLDRVLFTGSKQREVLKYYYAAADIFASTPWYEPFGMTPLEAMACAKPVIGTRVGGIKYSVIHDHTGILIRPKNATDLTKALQTLYDNPTKIRAFGQNGLKRVQNQFSWRFIAQKMESVYDKVLKSHQNSKHSKDLSLVRSSLAELSEASQLTQLTLSKPLVEAAQIISSSLKAGHKVLVAGNGGSAADASHLASEFVGRFVLAERPAMPVVALTTDTAFITAWSNDVSYADIFSRQIEGLGSEGDVFIAISTSGQSRNLNQALKTAQGKGMYTISFLGKGGGKAASLSDLSLVVPSDNTQRIQEVQINLMHSLVDMIEKHLFSTDAEHEPKLTDDRWQYEVLGHGRKGEV